MGYRDARRYLADARPDGIALDPSATVMRDPPLGARFTLRAGGELGGSAVELSLTGEVTDLAAFCCRAGRRHDARRMAAAPDVGTVAARRGPVHRDGRTGWWAVLHRPGDRGRTRWSGRAGGDVRASRRREACRTPRRSGAARPAHGRRGAGRWSGDAHLLGSRPARALVRTLGRARPARSVPSCPGELRVPPAAASPDGARARSIGARAVLRRGGRTRRWAPSGRPRWRRSAAGGQSSAAGVGEDQGLRPVSVAADAELALVVQAVVAGTEADEVPGLGGAVVVPVLDVVDLDPGAGAPRHLAVAVVAMYHQAAASAPGSLGSSAPSRRVRGRAPRPAAPWRRRGAGPVPTSARQRRW